MSNTDIENLPERFTREETAKALATLANYQLGRQVVETPVQVSYYFKPAGTYPARLYLLYGSWPERNRRRSGIAKQPCLYQRTVGTIEAEEIKDCGRLMSKQFEAGKVNNLIYRHMEDGLTDTQIQKMLDAVLPVCTPEFRVHKPVSAIRVDYNSWK